MDVVKLFWVACFFSSLGSIVNLFAVYAFLALELVDKDISNTVALWTCLSSWWQEAGDNNVGVNGLIDECSSNTRLWNVDNWATNALSDLDDLVDRGPLWDSSWKVEVISSVGGIAVLVESYSTILDVDQPLHFNAKWLVCWINKTEWNWTSGWVGVVEVLKVLLSSPRDTTGGLGIEDNCVIVYSVQGYWCATASEYWLYSSLSGLSDFNPLVDWLVRGSSSSELEIMWCISNILVLAHLNVGASDVDQSCISTSKSNTWHINNWVRGLAVCIWVCEVWWHSIWGIYYSSILCCCKWDSISIIYT